MVSAAICVRSASDRRRSLTCAAAVTLNLLLLGVFRCYFTFQAISDPRRHLLRSGLPHLGGLAREVRRVGREWLLGHSSESCKRGRARVGYTFTQNT